MNWKTTRKVLLAFCVSVGVVIAAQATPSIWTDKPDYTPGETVHIEGSGFAPGEPLSIKVIRPDGSVVTGDGSFGPWPKAYDSVVVDAEGCFEWDYILNGIEGTYLVNALDSEGTALASCTFTDGFIKTRLSLTLSPSTVCSGTEVEACASLEMRIWLWWVKVRFRNVDFYLDGVYVGSDKTSRDGQATLLIPTTGLTGNEHTIKAEYNGSWLMKPSETEENFTLNVAPSIVCPGNITQDADPGLCSTVVNWCVTASGSPPPTVSCDPPSGSTFSVGTTTVTCVATNTCGTDTCSFTVTVEDKEAPTTVFVTTPPNPDNNPTPFFAWAGTDNNACTAPANLEFSTNLDGDGWSDWSSSTSATIGPLAEGEHTFKVRARDEVGNVESTASYTWFVDLTPPVITLITPEDGAEYLFGSDVFANWSVRDNGSGLASTNATNASGEAIDTSSAGENPFFVEATDLAGNVARVDVSYRIVYILTPAGPAGGGGAVEGFEGALCFLDKCIAGGGGAIGGEPLAAIYELGDVISSALTISDGGGNLIVDAVGTITFVEITFVGEEEAYNIVVFIVIPYDETLGLYTIGVPTVTGDWQLEVGYYDVWFGFDDGTTIRHRIEIIEPVE